MREDLTGIIAHGHAELTAAEAMLARHQPDHLGLCSCMRALPCQVAGQVIGSLNNWLAQAA